MKRWLRPVLAILLGVLAAGCIGIVPAQAAKATTQTVTYRGYTLSWSKPDASDVRVVRTPGRADHFPARASAGSIHQAKSRVTNTTLQANQEQTDSCNFVPDSFGLANFTSACDAHDTCYRNTQGISRLACDLAFFALLRSACDVYSMQPGLRLTCLTVATIYFVGVRLFGTRSYTGNGSPA
jgi:phospholipase A2-like protein